MTGRGGRGGVASRYELAVLHQDEREAKSVVDSLVSANRGADVSATYEEAMRQWSAAHDAWVKAASRGLISARKTPPRDGAEDGEVG